MDYKPLLPMDHEELARHAQEGWDLAAQLRTQTQQLTHLGSPRYRLGQEVTSSLDRDYHGKVIAIHTSSVATARTPGEWTYLVLLDQPAPPAKSIATQAWFEEEKIHATNQEAPGGVLNSRQLVEELWNDAVKPLLDGAGFDIDDPEDKEATLQSMEGILERKAGVKPDEALNAIRACEHVPVTASWGVICENCQVSLDGRRLATINEIIAVFACPRCGVPAGTKCTSPLVPVVEGTVHHERVGKAIELGWNKI
jgi:hypothetical protein